MLDAISVVIDQTSYYMVGCARPSPFIYDGPGLGNYDEPNTHYCVADPTMA